MGGRSGGSMTLASDVSSASYAGIYYAPAHRRGGRGGQLGRSVRLVPRSRLLALRIAYKHRRRVDHVDRDVIRIDLAGLIARAARETVTSTGEHITNGARS